MNDWNPLTQVHQARGILASRTIPLDGGVDGVQKTLIAERLGEEIHRAGFIARTHIGASHNAMRHTGVVHRRLAAAQAPPVLHRQARGPALGLSAKKSTMERGSTR